MKCIECERETKTLFTDPRTTPFEEKPSLCIDCSFRAIDSQINELDNMVKNIKELRAELTKKVN